MRHGSLAHDLILGMATGWRVMHGLAEGARGRRRQRGNWLTDLADWTWNVIVGCVREFADRQK